MPKPKFTVLREYRLQTGQCHVGQSCDGYKSLCGCLAEWVNRSQSWEIFSVIKPVLSIGYGLVVVWLLKSTSGDCCSPSFLKPLFLPCAFPALSCLSVTSHPLFIYSCISQHFPECFILQVPPVVLAPCWPRRPWGLAVPAAFAQL